MTNWDRYGCSYQLASYAFEKWCERNMADRNVMCDDSTMCEICQARWYSLEWDKAEHERLVGIAIKDFCVRHWDEINWETNAESEKRLIGLREQGYARRLKLANSYGYSTYEDYMAACAAGKAP